MKCLSHCATEPDRVSVGGMLSQDEANMPPCSEFCAAGSVRLESDVARKRGECRSEGWRGLN